MIDFTPGTIVGKLTVADGSSGWTFSLPNGFGNNSEFSISGSNLVVGNGAAKGAYTRTVHIDANKSGATQPIRLVRKVIVGDRGLRLSNSSNLSLSEAQLSGGNSTNRTIQFNLFVGESMYSGAGFVLFDVNTTNIQTDTYTGGNAATLVLWFYSNGDLGLRWRKPDGSRGSYSFPNTQAAWLPTGWHTIKLTYSITYGFEFWVDGTIRLQDGGGQVCLPIGTKYIATSSDTSLEKMYISDIQITEGGTTVLSEPLDSTLGDFAGSSGTYAFPVKKAITGFASNQTNRLELPNGILPTGTPTQMELSFSMFVPSGWESDPSSTAQILGNDPNDLHQNSTYHGLMHIGQAYGNIRVYQYSNWDGVAKGSAVIDTPTGLALQGKWTDVRYTWDGTNSRLYIDGNSPTSDYYNTTAPWIPAGVLRIGSSNSGFKLANLFLKVNGTVYLAEPLESELFRLTAIGTPNFG